MFHWKRPTWDLFGDKSIQTAAEEILLEMPTEEQMLNIYVWQNKSSCWMKKARGLLHSWGP